MASKFAPGVRLSVPPGTMLGVLTTLIVADLTKRTGRFNLAQGFVGTMVGSGASLGTIFSSPLKS